MPGQLFYAAGMVCQGIRIAAGPSGNGYGIASAAFFDGYPDRAVRKKENQGKAGNGNPCPGPDETCSRFSVDDQAHAAGWDFTRFDTIKAELILFIPWLSGAPGMSGDTRFIEESVVIPVYLKCDHAWCRAGRRCFLKRIRGGMMPEENVFQANGVSCLRNGTALIALQGK